MGRITIELSLSATVTMALLFLSLACIDFIVWDSECVLCMCL